MKDFNLEFDDLTPFDMPDEIDGFDLHLAPDTDAIKTESVKIRRYPRPAPSAVRYERAEEMAESLPDIAEGETVFALVSGNFIFGDLLEALMVNRNWYAEEMIVATLSLGQENVDSLANLVNGGYVGRLGLIVSDFWYAHERRAAGGVPYIEKTLGGPSFTFAAAGLHTKITCIRTSCGRHLVLHGSANMRSSRNLEQVVIENNAALHEFNSRWMHHLLDAFSTTKKSNRGKKLWQSLPAQAESKGSGIGGKGKLQQRSETRKGNKV